MTAEEVLSSLRSLGVKIWANEDRLCYSSGRGVLTATLLSGLAEHKVEILTFLRQANVPMTPSLQRASREGNLPLSYAQQRLWFLDQLVPGNPFYNISAAVRLTTLLNVVTLERALNEIVRRHETLRTHFQTVDGLPAQVIIPNPGLPLSRIDLRDVPEPKREAEALRLAAAEAQQSFDLAHGPLVRTTLLQLGEANHVFLLTMHHIVCDGWSMGVFFQELSALYGASSQGQPSPLPELPIQYVDFAVWQRQWLQGQVLHAQLDYWKKQLADLPILHLPTDRPRLSMQSFQGSRQAVVISERLCAALVELSQREGVTLFMTLLAAFQTLLYRYTGQEDIVVGSPIANRNHAEIEGLIGFFVNTLVMRTDLSGEPSFRELLGRVREIALEAYTHQDLPFEQLVKELHPERDLSLNPLFQVAFQLVSVLDSFEGTPDPGLSSLQTRRGTTIFDLALHLQENRQSLSGQFEYSTDLFDSCTITRMIGHFQVLLEGITRNPEQRLSELPLLTEAERRQLLLEWNETTTPYPRDACIHELFEAQAQRTPEAIAVVFQDDHLTYQKLNRRANQLAHFLRKLGVGPEVRVGVCMQRSLDMIVGLLGVLKAGGAYVPLDPTYPKQRLAFMVEDAKVPVVLTQAELWKGFPECGIHVACLDVDWEEMAQASEENLPCWVKADSLAYVIYTSGSTGQPKGVSITHRAVNRLVLSSDYAVLNSSDRVAQISNASFDAATFEIWGALLHGARLIGINQEAVLSSQEFADQLREHEISVLFLTTDLFNRLVAERPGLFRSVRHLLFGGSVADPRRVREVLQQSPPQRLVHVYGPTESTTFASWHRVQEVPEEATTIPIGRPIANTKIYVLDLHLNPVPIGVPGELYIGGDGLARGYLNLSELTAERFVPNPFTCEPNERLYKTGDLARYGPDGTIEFLGRLDDQVKVRGFRIELGEIEAVLRLNPAVQESLVLAQEDGAGGKRLLAYLVPKQHPAPSPTELRRFLREKLPEYMVPSAFVWLEALPLTPNGKVDRRSLPVADHVRSPEERYVAPRTPLEETLVAIWEQILGLERIGVEDNFFDLGGHSLLATQVVSRIRDSLHLELPLRKLLEWPTVAGLVQSIMELQSKEHASGRNMIEPISRRKWPSQSVDLDQLSDEEVDSMLKEMLTSLDGLNP